MTTNRRTTSQAAEVGARATQAAVRAPPKAVRASHLRLLELASATAPTKGDSTAAVSIDSAIPHA